MKIQQKGTLIFVSVILFLCILSQQFSIPSITENQSKFNESVKKIDVNPPKTAISMEWNETWDIGLNEYGDYGYGIATDSEGNIYVAGTSVDSFYNCYAFLVKYDPDGNYLWNKTWNAGYVAGAYDITNDTSDNIYLAGVSGFFGNVIKFNSSGDVQWNETYYPEAFILYGITYSSNGFIYATGANPGIHSNITILKINSTNGKLEKFDIYESVGFETGGQDIAIDSLNNIYVVGRNDTYFGNTDIILLKYDSTLNLIWNVTWNNPFGSTHYETGSGLTIDSQDNIYITGSNKTGNDYDIILLKYDNEGNLLSQKSWDNSNGKDMGRGIDIDSEDSIYIVGSEQNSTGYNNSILIKFDDDGIQIWNQSWGGVEDDSGMGILVVNSENIFITGATDSFAKGYKPDIFIANFHISGKDVTPPIIDFENNENYLNNTSPSDIDLNLMINCSVSDTSDLFWVYLCENSTGAFINRSMTLGSDGNWTSILDISALNANDILMFLFYANDSWGNIARLDNGGLNYTITITSAKDITPPIINFENNENYLNNTSPSDTDLNLMINCSVLDSSDLFWVYLCENSTGAFINRSMTLGSDGNWTSILDISALNANDILMFLFYANDSWGNIARLDNGGLNYTITITSANDGGGILPGDDDDDDDDEEAAIPFGNNYIIFTVIAVISLIVIMKRKAILKKQ